MENCERALSDSMSTMSYRGPDASGNFNGERTRGFFGLGHVRLSILDLTEGANQPYQSKCGRYSLVFNGEIYNYRELREELKANGEVFVSRSDTEVLLNSYLAYGSKCLERLNGMFAFAIYDLELNKLFLARDHIGIKPIYYYYDPTSTDFYFASEIKALKEYPDVDASLSKEDVFEFFNNGWLYEPNTGYEFIKKIPPGCFAELSFSGDLVLERYFHLVKEAAKRTSAAEDKLPVLLKQALRLQYNADVPVGLFFSGGTDSTIIAGFSPGRPKSIYASYDASALKKSGVVDDELYVDPIKNELNFDVEVIHCNESEETREDIIQSFEHVARSTEELISDFTYLPSENICKLARERGYKVMLSGMGGDEVFAGYPRYYLYRYSKFFKIISKLLRPCKSLIKKIPRLSKKVDRFYSFFDESHFGEAHSRLIGYFSKDELHDLFMDESLTESYRRRVGGILEGCSVESNLKKAMYLDLHGFLSHNLMVADKSSMKQSIELRVPLLDVNLYQYAFSLPDQTLISKFSGKQPLKQLLKPILSKKLVERPKTGFNPPMDEKIMKLGSDFVLQIMERGRACEFLSKDAVRRIVSEHFSGVSNNTYKIWQLVYFAFWLKENSAKDTSFEYSDTDQRASASETHSDNRSAMV
tara:strand:+ start:5411 stop:7342 length:1932 start_codon:yes stop_codon:yes gene_type:complete